jgi:hypothetical protein
MEGADRAPDRIADQVDLTELVHDRVRGGIERVAGDLREVTAVILVRDQVDHLDPINHPTFSLPSPDESRAPTLDAVRPTADVRILRL